MAGVTTEGFTVKTLEQIRKGVEDKLIARFGITFDVSPESPDGQLIGVFSDVIFEAWQMGELSYNSFSPSKAFGLGLDNICEINHVTRYFETPTKASIQVVGKDGAFIPKGSVVKDDLGLEFVTEFDLTIDNTTDNSVSVHATVSGANVVQENSIVHIVTEGISGWTGVSNREAGVVGIDREQDTQLRNRRAASVVSTGTGVSASLYSALYRLGASYVVVLDNDTSGVVEGQPPHTIQCIVEGGNQVEIAKAIFAVKPYGIRAYGEVETSVLDAKGFPKVVGFSRTERTPIYVTVDFVRGKGSSFDSDVQIRTAVVSHINSLGINDDVVWSDIFEPVTKVVQGISIKGIFIGTSADPTASTDISVGIKQRAQTDEVKVVVNDNTP